VRTHKTWSTSPTQRRNSIVSSSFLKSAYTQQTFRPRPVLSTLLGSGLTCSSTSSSLKVILRNINSFQYRSSAIGRLPRSASRSRVLQTLLLRRCLTCLPKLCLKSVYWLKEHGITLPSGKFTKRPTKTKKPTLRKSHLAVFWRKINKKMIKTLATDLSPYLQCFDNY